MSQPLRFCASSRGPRVSPKAQGNPSVLQGFNAICRALISPSSAAPTALVDYWLLNSTSTSIDFASPATAEITASISSWVGCRPRLWPNRSRRQWRLPGHRPVHRRRRHAPKPSVSLAARSHHFSFQMDFHVLVNFVRGPIVDFDNPNFAVVVGAER